MSKHPSSAVLLSLWLSMICAASSLTGCGGDDPPVSQPAPAADPHAPDPHAAAAEEKPAAPQPINLAALSPVAIDPGATVTVALQVERNGNDKEIQVQVEGAPQGVTVKAAKIAADQSAGELQLTAAESLGDEPLVATLNVTVKIGQVEAKQPLELTVNKLNIPSFQPVASVVVQPGATSDVMVTIDRNGYDGPLALRVEGLPAKVTGKADALEEGETESQLQITAAADAANAKLSVKVAATYFGRTISVDVPLQVDAQPFVVKSFMAIMVKPGETKVVEVPVERSSHEGPIHIELSNLPEGVTVAAVDVPAKEVVAKLEFVAAEDAKERVRSCKVHSTAGPLSRTDPMVVRVSRGEGGFLPQEVARDPEMSALFRRGSFGGRLTSKSKHALVDAYGGTPDSEEAVLKGLRWLAKHQAEDGSWSLKDYHEGIEGCDCHTDYENEVLDIDCAGTAFGLLPFLGAGITHNRAPEEPAELAQYQDNVFRALKYLGQIQVIDSDPRKTGNLGGTMYSHAIATMALCEAYGLSRDDRMKVPTQLAVKYLVESQHESGGGWRYSPRQAGDMSATCWVFLAIRSGQLAGMQIDKNPLIRVERFIDSCAAGPPEAKFSQYAYTPGEAPKLTLSAAGLLTREFLGWKADDPNLLAGAKYLMENMPPETGTKLGQIYYLHYATQVLHHLEGSDFDLWNHRMREHVIRSQVQDGHGAGSWDPNGTDYGSKGGRLYSTAMAMITLQVYYRHLPMYRHATRLNL